MRAGTLRHKITVQQKSTTRDDYGQPLDAWPDVVTVRASAVNKGGGEFYAAQKINAEVTELFKTRYSTSTAAIKPKMRVEFGTRHFDILHINNVDEANKELQLLCRELVDNE